MSSSEPSIPSSSDPHFPVSSGDVLLRLAEEMRSLATVTGEVETNVSKLLREPAAAGDTRMMELQKLDVLRQSLEDLGRLTRNLARLLPENFHLSGQSLQETMHLAALALRVIHGREQQPRPADPAVHLFDYG